MKTGKLTDRTGHRAIPAFEVVVGVEEVECAHRDNECVYGRGVKEWNEVGGQCTVACLDL